MNIATIEISKKNPQMPAATLSPLQDDVLRKHEPEQQLEEQQQRSPFLQHSQKQQRSVQMALQLLLAKIDKVTVAMMRMVVRTEAILIFLAAETIAGFGGNILIDLSIKLSQQGQLKTYQQLIDPDIYILTNLAVLMGIFVDMNDQFLLYLGGWYSLFCPVTCDQLWTVAMLAIPLQVDRSTFLSWIFFNAQRQMLPTITSRKLTADPTTNSVQY